MKKGIRSFMMIFVVVAIAGIYSSTIQAAAPKKTDVHLNWVNDGKKINKGIRKVLYQPVNIDGIKITARRIPKEKLEAKNELVKTDNTNYSKKINVIIWSIILATLCVLEIRSLGKMHNK